MGSDLPAEFVPYSTSHVAALLIIAAVTAAAIALLRPRSGGTGAADRRRVICRSLGTLLLANVLAEQTFTIATGLWSPQEWLPLHLCDLAVLVSAAALFEVARLPAESTPALPSTKRHKRAQWLFEVAYYWGLGGTLQALLTPDLHYAFPAPVFFTYFTMHGAIVAAVLILAAGLKMRPRPGSAMRAWLLTNVVGLVIIMLNGWLGSNYMFMCGPPESKTILDLLGAWPWPFLLNLDILVALCIALCYAPFWIWDRANLRRDRNASRASKP